MKKKGALGLILIIILIIAGLGTSSYFMFFYNPNLLQRSNFPERIGEYRLDTFDTDKDDCGELNGEELCIDSARLDYREDSGEKSVQIIPMVVLTGREVYENYIRQGTPFLKGTYNIKGSWEVGWISKKYIIVAQHYTLDRQGETTIASPDDADINNIVVKYFLDEYPVVSR